MSDRSTEPDATDAQFPWRSPDIDRIQRLKLLFPALEGQAQEGLFDKVGEVQRGIEGELRSYTRKAPRAIAGAVVSAIAGVADQLASDKTWKASGIQSVVNKSDSAALREAARDLRLTSGDPRNAKEAVEALEQVEDLLSKSPILKKAGHVAVAELERKGVLGEGLMASVVEWMAVAGAVGAFTAQTLGSGELVLAAGPIAFSASAVGDFNLVITKTDKDWAGKNLRIQIQGKEGQVTRISVAVPYVLPIKRAQIVVRPEVVLRPGGDPTIGLSAGIKKEIGRGSLTLSPYARLGSGKGLVEQHTGASTGREAGGTLTWRFGEAGVAEPWSDEWTPPGSGLIAEKDDYIAAFTVALSLLGTLFL